MCNIVAPAPVDHDAPYPNVKMEADDEKCTHKASQTVTENRIENGKADEAAVGKHQRKLKDLGLVGRSLQHLADEKSKNAEQKMHDKADERYLPADRQIFGAVFHLFKRCENEHGLTNPQNKLGEPL